MFKTKLLGTPRILQKSSNGLLYRELEGTRFGMVNKKYRKDRGWFIHGIANTGFNIPGAVASVVTGNKSSIIIFGGGILISSAIAIVKSALKRPLKSAYKEITVRAKNIKLHKAKIEQ